VSVNSAVPRKRYTVEEKVKWRSFSASFYLIMSFEIQIVERAEKEKAGGESICSSVALGR